MRAGRVDGGDGLAGDPGPGQIDQIQPGSAAAVHRDDGEVGDVAVGHGELRGGQSAAGDGRGQAIGVGRTGAFRHGEGADRFASSKPRQPLLPLLLRAEQQERFRREIDRGRKRDWRYGAAQFLGQHADGEAAKADAAILIGDRSALPAHLGDPLP